MAAPPKKVKLHTRKSQIKAKVKSSRKHHIPEDIHLEGLGIGILISDVCKEIGTFLRVWLSQNEIISLPPNIREWASVLELYIDENKLRAIPGEITSLTCLSVLSLAGNDIQSAGLPPALPSSLLQLKLARNVIREIPLCILVSSITVLDLSHNQVTMLESLCSMHQLQRLDVSSNALCEIPPRISELQSLQQLSVDANNLKVLPKEFFALAKLESFSAAANQIAVMDPAVASLKTLISLDLRGNLLETIPTEFGGLVSLKHLLLQNNHLNHLPKELGNLPLETLLLSANALKDLPHELSNLEETLKEFDLKANPLSSELDAAVKKGTISAIIAYLKKVEEQDYLAPKQAQSAPVRQMLQTGPVRLVRRASSAATSRPIQGLFSTKEPSGLATSTKLEEAEKGGHALAEVLKDPMGFQSFREFLQDEHAEENLIFWEDTERYSLIQDPNERLNEARRLFDKYVSEKTAKFEINIPYGIKHELEQTVLNNNVTANTFKNAQLAIYHLMDTDPFLRFKKSMQYTIWAGIRQAS